MGKYAGKWVETPFSPIELPFSIESLRILLTYGASISSLYTHQQIADWAFRFRWECDDGSLAEVDDAMLSLAADVAYDVYAQWDLFLANTCSLAELQRLDFASVELPHMWSQEWLQQLRRA